MISLLLFSKHHKVNLFDVHIKSKIQTKIVLSYLRLQLLFFYDKCNSNDVCFSNCCDYAEK